MSKFLDGIRSFTSQLVNSRSLANSHYVAASRLSHADIYQIYRTGLGNKIVRIKAGDALRDALEFESADDEMFYKRRLASRVREVARWMIAFGRGLVLVHKRGDDLATPLSGSYDPNDPSVLINVFSGDMVSPMGVDIDLQSPRYMRPTGYVVRGAQIHPSRVIDFTYVKPPEMESHIYRYGGISEFELIYDQILADEIVQRASPRVIDKASTLFYKVDGFRDAMTTGGEAEMVRYFQQLESVRGLYAAGLVDKEDDLEVVAQSINNLADADQITLRRLAMVTGISVTRLIGEAPRGMNSTGEKEAQMDRDMLETLQQEYLLDPINQLMRRFSQGRVEFVCDEGDDDLRRIDYEAKAITNAVQLAGIGEDAGAYLHEHNITKPDDFDSIFGDEAPWEEEKHPRGEGGKFGSGGGGSPTPTSAPTPAESGAAKPQAKSEADKQVFAAAKADGVAIPPAWTNVTYHGKDGKNGVIAQGVDAKGRHQRVEVAAFREGKIREKHARIAKNLSPRMPKITATLRDDAESGSPEANVLYLITQTGFRIGSNRDTKAAKAAYGASTLRGEHVSVDGDTVTFDFPGKKGVRQQHVVKDPVIAKACAGAKPGEPVFKTTDTRVRAAWKAQGGEKVHDIRSHVATEVARAAIAKHPRPTTSKEFVALQKTVATEAAAKLGNRPQESLKTYINHDVFDEVRP